MVHPRTYTLDEAGLEVARAWLAQLADPLQPFAQPLDALATEVARGRRARRTAPIEQPGRQPGDPGRQIA
jgi:hypothetical protein